MAATPSIMLRRSPLLTRQLGRSCCLPALSLTAASGASTAKSTKAAYTYNNNSRNFSSQIPKFIQVPPTLINDPATSAAAATATATAGPGVVRGGKTLPFPCHLLPLPRHHHNIYYTITNTNTTVTYSSSSSSSSSSASPFTARFFSSSSINTQFRTRTASRPLSTMAAEKQYPLLCLENPLLGELLSFPFLSLFWSVRQGIGGMARDRLVSRVYPAEPFLPPPPPPPIYATQMFS